MSFSVCPIATLHAPADAVWALLDRPSAYAAWWDAQTESIDPPGPAQAGQRILAHSRAFGRNWPVRIEVRAVDAERRELELTTSLPLGITVLNHIHVQELDARNCRVSFG